MVQPRKHPSPMPNNERRRISVARFRVAPVGRRGARDGAVSHGSNMMSKPMLALLMAFIAAALTAGWTFGAIGVDQIVTLANMIVGWTLWTVAVAFAYSRLENLFPGVLCPRHSDEVSAPRAEGT